jgi:hypothetical protein
MGVVQIDLAREDALRRAHALAAPRWITVEESKERSARYDDASSKLDAREVAAADQVVGECP